MKKLIFILLLVCSSIVLAQKSMVIYDYQITRVVDGDTVAFAAPFLPSPLKKELSIRVYGVDTPEKGFRAKCPKEDKLGHDATDFTTSLIRNGGKIQVAILDWDKYGGRVLGDIIIDGKSLREYLINNNYARPYFGDAKLSWCN